MSDPFPSVSKVYRLVLQEESHKNNGHKGSCSSQPDAVAIYANSKGNSSWNKGNGKKEMLFFTHYNMLGHTIEKCYKLHGYPPGYKPKGKSTINENQVSSNLGNVAENASVATNQHPISKAQCEQLLAFLTSRIGLGDAHHAANVNTSCMATDVEGVSSVVLDMIAISAQT